MALGWLCWRAWFFRRGAGDAAAVGVALGDIHFRFTWQAWYLVTSTSTLAWQAWHLWHWAGSGGALGFRRGAGDAAAVGVAAMALGDIHLGFTWQVWYLDTSTSTLRGRSGTRLHSHVTISWLFTLLVHKQLLTQNWSTHHLLTHNLLTHNLSSHNLSTHNLSSYHFSSHHLLTHSLSSHHLSSDHFSSHHLSSHHLSSHNLSTHNLSSHNLSSHHLS